MLRTKIRFLIIMSWSCAALLPWAIVTTDKAEAVGQGFALGAISALLVALLGVATFLLIKDSN